MYPLFFGFPSHLDHHRALNRVPCAESNKDFLFPGGNEALSKWNVSRVPCSNCVLIMLVGYGSLHKVMCYAAWPDPAQSPPSLLALMMGSTQPVGTASSLAAMWAFTQPDSAVSSSFNNTLCLTSTWKNLYSIQQASYRESPAPARLC